MGRRFETKGKNGRSLSITMLKGFLFAEIEITQALAHEQRNKLAANTLSDRQAIP